MSDDCFVIVDVDDGVVRIIEFVEFFRCGESLGVEDVFVGDVEDAFEIGLDVVNELVVFVVGDVSCVIVVHDLVPFFVACLNSEVGVCSDLY